MTRDELFSGLALVACREPIYKAVLADIAKHIREHFDLRGRLLNAVGKPEPYNLSYFAPSRLATALEAEGLVEKLGPCEVRFAWTD